MTGKTDQILELLFGTPRLEEVPISDLKDLLEEFPSFNAAHYLLSKKLKLESSEEFSSETQRTALYFTNPFWLQWLLETPEAMPASDLMTGESAEMQESPVDIAGSESSVWTDHRSSLAEPSSYFEESIINDKQDVHQPMEEMVREEIHLTETDFSSFEKNPEPEVENRNEDKVEEYKETYNSPTELIIESFTVETTEIKNGDDISQPVEPETLAEYQNNEDPANGLNFLEPDDFREKSLQEVQQEEIFVTPETINYDEPAAEILIAPQETVVEKTAPVQDEIHTRMPFFWEKEFASKEHVVVNEPAEEEPAPIAQVPELSKPFQDNPAFLLAENETLVPDEGGKIQESVHLDPALQELKEEEKEARIFFEHNPAIWEPASIKEEEPVIEADAPAVEEPFVLQPMQENQLVEEKVNAEEVAVATTEFSDHTVQPMATEPSAAVADITGDELQFTPYHTIDYFASQGIRFIQEENPTDKFGKQLKSFTAWLKTMKRLPKTLLETDMSAMTEAAIQDIAEHSIEEKEITTEAMAQVLALQGQHHKAIELYQKLSLLNPSKNAYFAACIDQIKSDLR